MTQLCYLYSYGNEHTSSIQRGKLQASSATTSISKSTVLQGLNYVILNRLPSASYPGGRRFICRSGCPDSGYPDFSCPDPPGKFRENILNPARTESFNNFSNYSLVILSLDVQSLSCWQRLKINHKLKLTEFTYCNFFVTNSFPCKYMSLFTISTDVIMYWKAFFIINSYVTYTCLKRLALSISYLYYFQLISIQHKEKQSNIMPVLRACTPARSSSKRLNRQANIHENLTRACNWKQERFIPLNFPTSVILAWRLCDILK